MTVQQGKKDKPTSAKALRVFPPALPKAKCSHALPYLRFALMFSALPVGEPQQREPFPGRVKLQNLIRAAAPRGSAGNQTVKLQLLRGPGHSRELLELPRDGDAQSAQQMMLNPSSCPVFIL